MTKFEKIAEIIGTNNPQAVIAHSVAALVEAGFAANVALDMVCGEGSYQKLVDQLYTELRAKAGCTKPATTSA